MGMFPARLKPQAAAGSLDAGHRAFYEAIKRGRTYAPIPQWGRIENAYKNRLAIILDAAAGHGRPYNGDTVQASAHGGRQGGRRPAGALSDISARDRRGGRLRQAAGSADERRARGDQASGPPPAERRAAASTER